VRHILLAEPLLEEFGACLEGATAEDVERMMGSFLFENCVQREELTDILAEFA